jgi:hypothetical protein
MRQRQIVFLTIAVHMAACSTTQQIVRQETSSGSVEFVPIEASKEIKEGFALTVKPLDASELDRHAYFFSRLDGRFLFDYTETAMVRYYNTLETGENTSVVMRERRKQSFGLLDSKVQSGEMPSKVADFIKYKIKAKDEIGKNGLQPRKSSMWEVGQNKNPYFRKGGYMSIFQLTVENHSGKNETVELEKLLIQNGNEQLYPYSTEKLLDYDYTDDQKSNLHRMNMPTKLIVPDGEMVVKFISTPPLNAKESVSVQYIVGDDVEKFDFRMEVEESKENTDYARFEFIPKTEPLDVKRFYAVIVTSSDTTILKENIYYYPLNKLNDSFSIYAIHGIDYGFQYGFLRGVRFSDYSNGKVKIPFQPPVEYNQ